MEDNYGSIEGCMFKQQWSLLDQCPIDFLKILSMLVLQTGIAKFVDFS